MKCPECGFEVVNIPKNIGPKLRKEREKRAVKAVFVAHVMHVSTNYLYMLETGKRRFNHGLIHRFNKALGQA